MAVLAFYKNEELLFEHQLWRSRITIGRSDSCDIALPDEELSRQHCVLEQKTDGWVLIDQSKHGTFIAGTKITRAPLRKGIPFRIGPYDVFLQQTSQNFSDVSETVAVVSQTDHELVLVCDSDFLVIRPRLRVVHGPDAGMIKRIDKSEIRIGGKGSDIELTDPTLHRDHCIMKVSRGRAMVQNGSGSVYLDGQKIRGITPVYPDEEVRIGDTFFKIIGESEQITPEAHGFGRLLGNSKVMKDVFGRLEIFAGHDFPVLILGESGTGKELAARGLHEHSSRATGPFLAINCASIPENLVESELFGHEKGAFSGATHKKDGAFQQADKGTLFLDELAELSPAAQTKLLRVLENGEIRRVGATQAEYPDVRIITATNRSLSTLVALGKFREDLLFRLQVLSIQMPPLRERMDDIPLLVHAIASGLHPNSVVSPEVITMLQSHSWPGNVRELKNVIARAYVLSGGKIQLGHIEIFAIEHAQSNFVHDTEEDHYLEQQFLLHRQNISEMSRALGVPRSSLRYKLRRMGLIK